MSINKVQSPIISNPIISIQTKNTILSFLILHNNKKGDF